MRHIAIEDIAAAALHIEALLEAEGELVVTRGGEPVARVLPLPLRDHAPSHADLRQRMPLLKAPSEQLVREDRERR